MSAAHDQIDEKHSGATRCEEYLERTRRLVAELRELADAARAGCDQDGCLLVYGVVEDCCHRIGSLLDWRDQRLTARPTAEANASSDAGEHEIGAIPAPQQLKDSGRSS